jgi:hypothetical protein
MKMRYKDVEFEIESVSDIDMIFEHIKKGEVSPPQKELLPFHSGPSVTRIKIKKEKLKLTGKNRNHKYWSVEEDRYLLANMNKKNGELSKKLGRKRSAVRRRKQYLLTQGDKVPDKRPRWTDESSIVKSGKKPFVMNDFHKKTIGYLKEGKLQEDVAKLMSVSLRKIYNLSYTYRQMGLLPKIDYIKIRKQQVKSSFDDVIFATVPANKMDAAKDLVRGCIKSKCALTVKDCGTYLGLSQSEALAFLVDLFNQQSKLGYKVKLSNDKAVFE